MARKNRVKDIQQSVRESQGLSVRELPPADGKKTTLMRHIESRFNDTLENLIAKGKIEDVGHTLGVDASTIYRWRVKFGIE